MRGAARQACAAGAVLGVEKVDRGAHTPRTPARAAAERGALQARAADVACAAEVVLEAWRAVAAVGFVADELAHVVAVDRGVDARLAPTAIDTKFAAAATLGLDAGHAVAGVVEVVQARRLEGRAQQRTHTPGLRQAHARAQATSVDDAELRVVVAPRIGLQVHTAELAGVGQHGARIAPLHVAQEGAGLRVLAEVVEREGELLIGQRLPARLRIGLAPRGAVVVDQGAAGVQVALLVGQAQQC